MLASVDEFVFKHTGEDLRNAVANDLKQRDNAKLKAFIASARTVEKAKTHDDFDWEKLIITNELRENLYVSQLDLFLMANFNLSKSDCQKKGFTKASKIKISKPTTAVKCFRGSKAQFVLIGQRLTYWSQLCPQSFFDKSWNDLVSLINYMYIVIFSYVVPFSDMLLIMYCMHMSFRIHQRKTIQSYFARKRTNTRRTFQGGAKCIPPVLLMSVDIFARQHAAVFDESLDQGNQ